MTGKQFFDWQTAGGTDDVMRLVDILERPTLRKLHEFRGTETEGPGMR